MAESLVSRFLDFEEGEELLGPSGKKAFRVVRVTPAALPFLASVWVSIVCLLKHVHYILIHKSTDGMRSSVPSLSRA